MNPSDLTVTIVGGATGGCVSALLLARAGARVTVLERVQEPRAVGAGIAIAENGFAVLEALGLGGELAGRGEFLEGVRVVDGRGRVLLRPRGREPRVLMLRRSDLQDVLLGALASETRIELCLGVEVLEARTDGTVVFAGPTGDESLSAALVIGADGVHSRIRASGSFGATVRRPGFTYMRALVGPGLARTEEAWTREGLFGSFPVGGGTYVYASTVGQSGQLLRARGDLAAWKEAWSRTYAPSAEILAGISSWDDLLVNEVIRVDCERFFDGRLALLGDAAHAMAPNVGQGANSAMVDAAVLVSSLRDAADLPTALVAYDQRRRRAVRRVADTAARLGALAEWSSAPARWLRDRALLPLAGRLQGEEALRIVFQESSEALKAMCGSCERG